LSAISYIEEIGHLTTASHTCSFGLANNAYAFNLKEDFKKSKLNFIAFPTENIYLQRRHDTYPKIRGLTSVNSYLKKNLEL